MPKASPINRSFNAGEFSHLLASRDDLEKFPASMRRMENLVATPQGPATCRSGTRFYQPAYGANSVLLPFVFSADQAKVIEVSNARIRFFDEDGVQTYAPVAAFVTSAEGEALSISAATLNAEVGDEVALAGFDTRSGVEGKLAVVTAKAGNVYTFDRDVTLHDTTNCTLARVYHIDCAFSDAHLSSMRALQSVDVMYLFMDGAPYTLSRYGSYDWRLEVIDFIDGPFMPAAPRDTRMTTSSSCNAATTSTGNANASSNRPFVGVGDLSSNTYFLGRRVFFDLFSSFDNYLITSDKYWAANTRQTAWVEFDPTDPNFIVDGFMLLGTGDNDDPSYLATDFMPSDFKFQGFRDGAWTTLESQNDYVLYDNGRSVFFEIDNETAYDKYRLYVYKVVRNGPIEPRIGRLVLREKNSRTTTLTLSGTRGVNRDAGFVATDVGRLVRTQGSDGAWRSLRITNVISPTQVTAYLLGAPFPDGEIRSFRMGYWSDTTGWPTDGVFFGDRLWLGGSVEAPDLVAGSVVGEYTQFSQTDEVGKVLDDGAIVFRLNSRKLSRVAWLAADDRSILVGTGSEEYSITGSGDEPLTPTNFRAKPATKRGSAKVGPVFIDSQVVFVQRGGRTVREFTYVFEADGYRSPSMSQLASHIGVHPFAELEYAAEPHSVVWGRRADGTLAGLTYNRDENVVGWHRHSIGNVKSITVIPSKSQLHDDLWLITVREVDGGPRRYIERLMPFWDFTFSMDDAHYIDSALVYEGDETRDVYGLDHLEGLEVYAYADNRAQGPYVVTNGAIRLELAASRIKVGLGFESVGHLQRQTAGAGDGTAQGKPKRVHGLTLALWNSYGGEVGVYDPNEARYRFTEVEYPSDYAELQEPVLYTGDIGPFMPDMVNDTEGLLAFRRPAHHLHPFNVVALLPQLHTQDR